VAGNEDENVLAPVLRGQDPGESGQISAVRSGAVFLIRQRVNGDAKPPGRRCYCLEVWPEVRLIRSLAGATTVVALNALAALGATTARTAPVRPSHATIVAPAGPIADAEYSPV